MITMRGKIDAVSMNDNEKFTFDTCVTTIIIICKIISVFEMEISGINEGEGEKYDRKGI